MTASFVTNQPPVAIASADVTSGPAPLTVQFDGSQSFDPEGGALVYRWLFQDGTSNGATANITHTYQQPGNYSVTFRTIDAQGALGEDTLLITVTSPINNPPTASPTATPNSGNAPLSVQFDAQASDPDSDPLSTDWDFGDPGSPDNSSSAPSPSHSYDLPGTYVVWLTVSDGIDAINRSVTVVADSPGLPSLDLSVRSAKLKLEKQGTKSKLKIKLDFLPPVFADNDILTLVFANREVFAAPFASFVAAGSDDEEDDSDSDGLDDDANPFKYKLEIGKTKIELDIAKGRLEVQRKHMDLAGFDPAGGTVLELHIGNHVGIETVPLAGEDEELEFKR